MAVLACPDADQAVDPADLLVFMAAAAWAGDDWPLAARAAAAARAVGERFADPHAVCAARAVGAAAELLLGRPEQVVTDAQEVLTAPPRPVTTSLPCSPRSRWGWRPLLAGNPDEGLRCYAAAQTHQVRIGRSWPRHPGTEEILTDLQGSVDAQDYDRAWGSGQPLGIDELSAELA